ncbi:hypothetical protein SLE2022_071100 [Rubroshorea leprosula]
MEGNEVLRDFLGGRTVLVCNKGRVGADLVRGVPGHPQKKGEREEGVHVDDAVEGVDVDTGGHCRQWNSTVQGVSGQSDYDKESRMEHMSFRVFAGKWYKKDAELSGTESRRKRERFVKGKSNYLYFIEGFREGKREKGKKLRRCRGSNPGRPRDRREYSPLYYNDSYV